MKGKPVDEVTAARIRKAVREGRVEIAPQVKISDNQQQVAQILRPSLIILLECPGQFSQMMGVAQRVGAIDFIVWLPMAMA